MPLYEYICSNCGQQFEELVRGQEQPICPKCGSPKVEKQLSKVAAHSAESGQASHQSPLPCGMPPGCCSGQCGLT
ncbi:MAG TPA: zinc ribbon domain-containing protein [Thermoguttaceae bacterium]|nr:zinc ribbon domain-containing protein [Thermoguttaceae bacterium]HPP52343.1 zinc ribbon domain-containing protein [Thermoguttaceae bacterium]